MATPPYFRHILLALTVFLLGGCGVKGDPIPYVQVHAEKKEAPPPAAAAKPTPAPTNGAGK